MSGTALFVSPHLDDAVFSCGGIAARLSAEGWRVVIATVFTRSVPDPTGFALACQTDKGLGPDVDYMAIRRAEDVAACAMLGAEPVWMDAREAPHRGYHDAPSLFRPPLPDDPARLFLPEKISAVIAAHDPDLVFGPECLGAHVDHVLVRAALEAVRTPDGLWRDQPYAHRHALPIHPSSRAVAIGPWLDRKRAACCAYATQLGFQFGGVDATRETITAIARTEGDVQGPSEWIAAPSAAARTALDLAAQPHRFSPPGEAIERSMP